MGSASSPDEHEMLAKILDVTLVSPTKVSPTTSTPTFLPEFASQQNRFSVDDLDLILLERMQLPGFSSQRTHFDFIVRSYERAAAVPDTNYSQTLCTRLAAFSVLLLSPGMLSESASEKSMQTFMMLLAADPKRNSALPDGFVRRMVDDDNDPSTTESLFRSILEQIEAKIVECRRMDDALTPLRCLRQFLDMKGAVSFFVNSRFFKVVPIPGMSGGSVVMQTLLGRALALSWPPLQNVRQQTQASVDQWSSEVASAFNLLVSSVHQIINRLFVGAPECLDAVLQWLAMIARYNAPRKQMRCNPLMVAPDHFFNTLSLLILRLVKPILTQSAKSGSSRLNSVDLRYCIDRRYPPVLLDYKDVTRVNMTLDALDAMHSSEEIGAIDYHFVTHMLFLGFDLLHLGLIRSMQKLGELQREYHFLSNEIERVPGPSRHQMILDNLVMSMFLTRATVFSPIIFAEASFFFDNISGWLLNLHQESNPLLGALPEYVVGDVIQGFLWLNRVDSSRLQSQSLSNLFSFAITFMPGSSSPLKNPHLRGEITELLHASLPPENSVASNGHVFMTHEKLRENLVSALFEIFVEVEATPISDRLHSRQMIAEMLEFLWMYPEQRKKFHSLIPTEEFTKFLNLLLNDCVYLLDESLKTLKSIRQGQDRMKDRVAMAAMSREDSESFQQEFSRNEDQASGLCKLANTLVSTLQYLAKDDVLHVKFLTPQFVDRMAQMLDYYLVVLIGPEVLEINVDNPGKYNFIPRKLLAQIVEIFSALARDRTFCEAVVQDGRSYKPVLFRQAWRVCCKRKLMPPAECDLFLAGIESIANIKLDKDDEEALLRDVPDEFLDPIMQSLMHDPVILPVSRQVMERAVIERHLLNNSSDPFNRQPLTKEELIPDVELKQRIDQWLEARGKKN